ncbi:ABC transporter substrate-binding protein [Streptomyces sp. NPDC098789]|uniref:ABC transporter substrate-binding protein n=1 Tax=Streptomyces sp. NPDC098789 TaxID=3366098 RepID=UPI003817F179
MRSVRPAAPARPSPRRPAGRPGRRRGAVPLLALALAGLLTLVLGGCGSAADAGGARTKVTIGIGGQPLLPYLPTTLAQQLGFYEDEGLDVELQDLKSGSKALQAMQGGSVDVASGYYDHTVQMQAKGKDVRAFVNMLRTPSIVLVVSPKASREITSPADLKGAKVGITAPGSSTDFFLKYLLGKNGLAPDAASVQAVGGEAAAIAAMESGRVDAAVMVDPAVSLLQKRMGGRELRILADTRTPQGSQEVFGVSSYPAAVFYAGHSWLEKNEATATKLTRAMLRTLRWIQDHSAQEIADAMPKEYAAGDPEVYRAAIEHAKPGYSADGAIDAAGARAAAALQKSFSPEVAAKEIDLGRTYTNDLVGAAAR